MSSAARQAFVGIGANLGDRTATLGAAVQRLGRTRGIEGIISSPVYETEPIGLTEQPRFLNAVLGIDTTLTPEALLTELQAVEQRFGRVRLVRWGPRTLDLDLLAYEGEQRDTPALTIPHPRMFERAFMLVPLRQLLDHPHFARKAWDSLRALVAASAVDASGVRLCGRGALTPRDVAPDASAG